jgi:hypothetical protein
MIIAEGNRQENTTTHHSLVVPFYLYAAASFVIACILLVFHINSSLQHFFNPTSLAITHTMALGWGTMMILGAAHQLLPVLIEGKLYSKTLAKISFYTAAFGIPMLVYGFYTFKLNIIPQAGGVLINLALLSFTVNTGLSIFQTKKEDVHALFAFTASCWLLLTTLLGLLLLINLTENFLPNGSVYYLSLHAHMGIVGWFLMMVIGVGARLLPLFLISKYSNNSLLWKIFFLLNIGLVVFVFQFLYVDAVLLFLVPVLLIFSAMFLFFRYIRACYFNRIRKKVDAQVRLSLFSIPLMILPSIVLLVSIIVGKEVNYRLGTLYGFVIFFGWLTAIILGMTFKTLPFIVWNRIHHDLKDVHAIPSLKEFIGERLFISMVVCYAAGFLMFIAGVLLSAESILMVSSAFLLVSAVLYAFNVIKVNYFPPVKPSV